MAMEKPNSSLKRTLNDGGERPLRVDSGRPLVGLGIREWQCDACGSVHGRDVNAALNILAAGRNRLAG